MIGVSGSRLEASFWKWLAAAKAQSSSAGRAFRTARESELETSAQVLWLGLGCAGQQLSQPPFSDGAETVRERERERQRVGGASGRERPPPLTATG